MDSFLIEITANILKYKDEDGLPLVTKIRDAAGQKGTGKWTAISGITIFLCLLLFQDEDENKDENQSFGSFWNLCMTNELILQ